MDPRFKSWFHDVEVYGLRSERFYNDLENFLYHSEIPAGHIVQWLEAAFEEGYRQGKSDVVEPV